MQQKQIIKMVFFKNLPSIIFSIILIKDSLATYNYTRFPVGIGGKNNNMEYLVMDVSSDQKVAVAGKCLDNNMCGLNDNVFVGLIDDVNKQYTWSKYIEHINPLYRANTPNGIRFSPDISFIFVLSNFGANFYPMIIQLQQSTGTIVKAFYSEIPYFINSVYELNNFQISNGGPLSTYDMIFSIRPDPATNKVQALVKFNTADSSTSGIIEMVAVTNMIKSVLEDSINAGYFIQGYYQKASPVFHGIFVSYVNKATWTVSWEALTTGASGVNANVDHIQHQSQKLTTIFGCGLKLALKALFTALDLSSIAPSNQGYFVGSVQSSYLGCYGIYGIDQTQAYALVADSANTLTTYIMKLQYQLNPGTYPSFKSIVRFTGLEKLLQYPSNLIRQGLFLKTSSNNVYLYFIGTLTNFQGASNTSYTFPSGYLMRMEIQENAYLSGDTYQDYYFQFVPVATQGYGRIGIAQITTTPILSKIQSTAQSVSTFSLADISSTDMTLNAWDHLESLPPPVYSPSCFISYTPVTNMFIVVSVIAQTNTQSLNSLQDFIVTPSPAQCPPLIYYINTQDSAGNPVTSSRITDLFQVYDQSTNKKALYVTDTADTTVGGTYNVSIFAKFANPAYPASPRGQDHQVIFATSDPCSTQTIARVATALSNTVINFQAFYTPTTSYSLSNPFVLTPTAPTVGTCFYYHLVEITAVAPFYPAVALPSFLTKNDHILNFITLTITSMPTYSIYPSKIFTYQLYANHLKQVAKNNGPNIMYQVQINIQHECYNVSTALTPSANFVGGIVIGSPSQIIEILQFTNEDMRLTCVNYNFQFASNSSIIGSGGNYVIGMTRDTNNGSFIFDIKTQTLASMSPQQFQFNLVGQNAHLGSSVSTLILLTYCSMSPNSADINLMNPYVFAATSSVSYSIGSSAQSLAISQFSTDAVCASKGIDLSFSMVTLDLSNGNVLSYSPLPAYVTGSFNAGGLTGGSIRFLSSDFTVLSSDFFISVEGTFQEATQSQQYQARLIVPVSIINPVPPNIGPPVLDSPPPSTLDVYVNQQLPLSFGSIADPDGNPFTFVMNFNLANSFATGLFPHYVIAPSSNSTDPGIYSLILTLTDTHPINPLTQTYTILLTVLPLPPLKPLYQIIIPTQQLSTTSKPKSTMPLINSTNVPAIATLNTNAQQISLNVSKSKASSDGIKAQITQIKQNGQVRVTFDKDMVVPGNLTVIDSRAMKIEVKGKMGIIKMWNVTEFTQTKGMIVQIQFKEPLQISQLVQDILEIEFILSDMFVSFKNRSLMVSSGTIMTKKIPRQLMQDIASNTLIKSLGPASVSLNSVVYANLAINVATSASLQMLWGMINVMQLIVQLPLLNISFPQNAATFYSLLQNISSFDLIPADKINEKIFNFTEQDEEDLNFVQMGITKKNVIQNLGSMFDYIASFLIASALALIIRIFRNKHPWIMKLYNYIAGILFFNLILRLIIEGYMDFSISSFSNVTNMLWNTKSDVAASIVTILTIIVVAVFPGLIWILVKKNHEKLQEKEKIQEIGTIYYEFKIGNTPALHFNVIQILRRLLIAFISVFMKQYSFAQVQIVIINSNFMLYYLLKVRPFAENFNNHLETFNEICILIGTYHLLAFTDFVDDPLLKYKMGWSLIIISLFNIAVNVGIIIWSALVTLKKVVLRIKNKYCPKKKITKDVQNNENVLPPPPQPQVSVTPPQIKNATLSTIIEEMKNDWKQKCLEQEEHHHVEKRPNHFGSEFITRNTMTIDQFHGPPQVQTSSIYIDREQEEEKDATGTPSFSNQEFPKQEEGLNHLTNFMKSQHDEGEAGENWRKQEFTQLIEGLRQNGMLKIHRGIGRHRRKRM